MPYFVQACRKSGLDIPSPMMSWRELPLIEPGAVIHHVYPHGGAIVNSQLKLSIALLMSRRLSMTLPPTNTHVGQCEANTCHVECRLRVTHTVIFIHSRTQDAHRILSVQETSGDGCVRSEGGTSSRSQKWAPNALTQSCPTSVRIFFCAHQNTLNCQPHIPCTSKDLLHFR